MNWEALCLLFGWCKDEQGRIGKGEPPEVEQMRAKMENAVGVGKCVLVHRVRPIQFSSGRDDRHLYKSFQTEPAPGNEKTPMKTE
jgi:hypothetical protein